MQPPIVAAAGATRVRIDGAELVSFAGCSYLGLHAHPAVLAAARDALDGLGLSTGASRTTCGTHPSHLALEERCEELYECAAALLPDGWIADAAVAEVLAATHTHALLVEGTHASMRAALRASGIEARYVTQAELEPALGALPVGSVSVWVEGYEPGRERVAALDELLVRCAARDALLVVDDAHGLGVTGARGLGAAEGRGEALRAGALVVTLALSKSLGAAGGVVLASERRLAELRAKSASYSGTTPVPPVIAAAASAALERLRDEPELLASMRANALRLRAALAARGADVSTKAPLPVVGLAPRGADSASALSDALAARGVYVPHVAYPGGPSASWLRFAASAAHTDDDFAALERALDALD